MAFTKISGVRIAGIASAVPDEAHFPSEFFSRFGEKEVAKITQNIGVAKRYLAPIGMCASDLCVGAANRLFEEGKFERPSIDAVVFISQSADYEIPFTAGLLQRRLGLATSCTAFDVNLGCSGYVYGLWLAGSLIAGAGMRQVLLLVGDTSTKVSPEDKSVALLFGDAGTATILQRAEEAEDLDFVLGTDGSGEHSLIIPAGGCRSPSEVSTRIRRQDASGNRRSEEELYMNGAEIFAFTLARVPKMVEQVLAYSGSTLERTDYVVLHQANKFINDYLIRRMKIPADKAPMSIGEYGNTSSASIPVTMTHCLRQQLSSQKRELLLAGFGVGYSWAAVTCTAENIVMPQMVFLNREKANSEV